MPSQILVLRHAEKPHDDGDTGLSQRGRLRAAALAVYLPDTFGRPTHLFATKDTKESSRPRQTITPLAEALRLPIDTRFADDDFEDLARFLISRPDFENATVAVCWHHGTIPELARALGVGDAPDRWGDEVFDRVWHIIRSTGHTDLKKVHQQLLFGDSPEE